MSLSSGWPGLILFSMPSRPAIIIAANARYGLQDGSGGRNSSRLAFGLAEYMGMRTAARGRSGEAAEVPPWLRVRRGIVGADSRQLARRLEGRVSVLAADVFVE